MSGIYGDAHRHMQALFETTALADRVRDIIVAPDIADPHKGFIETRDLIFLSTVDHRGFPTCSYKGGAPGFVRVLDGKTLAFPSYDGNGMFLSMGNIAANPKVGLLFIDFETPHRIRVHGTARVDPADPLLAGFPGAELLVRVEVAEIFVNCPRYIHKHQRVAASQYVPQADGPAPLPPWKRIDAVQDVLPERDRDRVADHGGTITPEEYGALVMKGEA